jgi:hypothetical protein
MNTLDSRDVHYAHMYAIDLARMRATTTNVAAFGPDHLHLQLLGTHTQYRRLGAATKLVKWGMDKAFKDQVVLTLLGGGAGYALYKGLGFEDIAAEEARVEGEDECVAFVAMAYRPPAREVTPPGPAQRSPVPPPEGVKLAELPGMETTDDEGESGEGGKREAKKETKWEAKEDRMRRVKREKAREKRAEERVAAREKAAKQKSTMQRADEASETEEVEEAPMQRGSAEEELTEEEHTEEPTDEEHSEEPSEEGST